MGIACAGSYAGCGIPLNPAGCLVPYALRVYVLPRVIPSLNPALVLLLGLAACLPLDVKGLLYLV